MKNFSYFCTALYVVVGVGLAGCSQAQRDNRQAGIYAERLEREGEGVAASEYSAMVEFYCGALDRTLLEIEPAARAHSAALEANDSAAIRSTERALEERSAAAHKRRSNLIRLGSGLQRHLVNLPDSSRIRLINHVMEITLRYSDFH